METDGQALYSVLTRKEVGEKMMKEINQISEVFSLSKSDATVILIRLRWNSFKASDRLGDDKEKFLADLGLVKEKESVSCLADQENDSLVSTPFCSHKFSETSWKNHLHKLLGGKKKNIKNEEETVVAVLCPNQDCVAAVGPETIEKLKEPVVKEMYESYVLGSFMEANKESIKWCPASGCVYALERHEDLPEDGAPCLAFGVVCLCGHTFCWSCQLESHRPMTCEEADVWCNTTLGTLKSAAWCTENTKHCPRCTIPVQRDGDPNLRLITCICSCRFCWFCYRSEEAHNGKWNCVEVSFPPLMNQDEEDARYLRLWEACREEFENSKLDLKDIEENGVPSLTDDFSFNDGDVDAVKEASLLMVQCRLVLKWSCAYQYMITKNQSAKKPYVKHLREDAIRTLLKHREIVEELMNQALSSGDFSCFKLKLSGITETTGNYFHGFVKNLERGLPEVQVDT